METITLYNANNDTSVTIELPDGWESIHPFIVTLDDHSTAVIRALGHPEDGYPGSDQFCLKDGLTNIEVWRIG